MTYRFILAVLSMLTLSASLTGVARAGQQVHAHPVALATIHMVTPTVGWATNATRILRTTDGGVRWVDVTPKVRTVVVAGQLFHGASTAQFLDAAHAWVAQLAPASPVMLWRTVDGGITWQAGGTLPARYASSPLQLRFVDQLHGWALIEGGGMHTNALSLFRTSDGGRRWVAVALHLPIAGLLSFRTATTGWGTDEHAGGVAAGPTGNHAIYVTHDGGRTWQTQVLPSPVGYLGSVAAFGGGPSFSTSQDGILPVTLFFPAIQQPDALVLYITDDGGRTWRPTTPLSGGSTTVTSVLSAHHVWMLNGRIIYQTRDGGRHWQAVHSHLPLDNAYLLDVVTLHVWFVLAGRSTAQGRATLLKTLDGGQTWVLVQPLLHP